MLSNYSKHQRKSEEINTVKFEVPIKPIKFGILKILKIFRKIMLKKYVNC